jgi:hypothetical protein
MDANGREWLRTCQAVLWGCPEGTTVSVISAFGISDLFRVSSFGFIVELQAVATEGNEENEGSREHCGVSGLRWVHRINPVRMGSTMQRVEGWYPHPELNRNPRFRKPLLYPFELWGQAVDSAPITVARQPALIMPCSIGLANSFNEGRGRGIQSDRR